MLTIGGTKSTPLLHGPLRYEASLSDERESVYQESDRWCNGGTNHEMGDDYYELGVCNAYYLANKDANPDWPPSAFVRMFSPESGQSYEYITVKEIIRAYVLAAEKGTIPEYVTPNHETVVLWMKRQYPHWGESMIRVVLMWLSQGVRNGIISPMLLQPRTLKARDQNTLRPEVQTFSTNYNARRDQRDEEEDWTGKIGTIAKTGAIIVAIGVGAYALMNVTKLVQTFKPAAA